MSEQISSDEITLKELVQKIKEWVRYFKSKLKIIIIFGFLGFAVGLTQAFLDKPVYKAELVLALEDKGAGGGSYAGIASQFGIDLGGAGGGAFSGENTIELMKSRNIIEKALLTPVEIDGKKDLLINRFIDFNELRKKWAKSNRPGLENIQYVENEDRKLFGIAKDSVLYTVYKGIKKTDLTVEKIDKKLSIIKVTLKSKDEIFAKYFTEVLVNAASDLYVLTKTQKSKKNLEILEERLDSVKRELDKNIYAAASTKDQNYNIIRAKGNISFSQKQLNVQVLTTMYGELIKNTEIAKYTLMREEPLIQIIDTPIFPLEKTKLGKIKGALVGGILGTFFILLALAVVRLKTIFLTKL
ncbi:MAG: Wzz/FepE/Etk N-terminal domain-containing protein [Bacteroidota bacterium]